jgi:excisionase family DNA binding protein
MARPSLSRQLERELNDIQRSLAEREPDLAQRFEQVVDALRVETAEPEGYISTGEAASALGVSPNTVKKWVRMGIIRDFWTLPGSGYVKIARSEVQRVREEGAARTVEVPQ